MGYRLSRAPRTSPAPATHSRIHPRCLARGKGDKPILLPHVIQDELCAVCDECNNPALRNSELAMMLKTVQARRGGGQPAGRRQAPLRAWASFGHTHTLPETLPQRIWDSC